MYLTYTLVAIDCNLQSNSIANLQLQSTALSLLNTVCSLQHTHTHTHTYARTHAHAHRALVVCCPTPALWYRISTADVPLPGFPNCPRPTATLDPQCAVHLELPYLVSYCSGWSSVISLLSISKVICCYLISIETRLP
jgi:hypothetical protein